MSTYLGLSEDARGAIGLIRLTQNTSTEVCTGVLVSENAVVTAAHCVSTDWTELHVLLHGASRDPLQVSSVVRHSSRDIAILHLADRVVGLPPFAILNENADDFAGAAAEIAGFGVSELGKVGELRFAVVTVQRVEEGVIVTRGSVGTGACLGDSGGPLIVRASDGLARVAGLLSRGSSSCLGEDEFERVDALRGWIAEQVGEPDEVTELCGDIDIVGRCYSAVAVWCKGAELGGERCTAPLSCGWDSAASGFRCVETDPCSGVPQSGICLDERRRVWCNRGVVLEDDCGACNGGRCGWSRRSGGAECFGG